MPPLKPHTKEIRRHEVLCDCGHKTRAAYDPTKIPTSPFGPRLVASVALLTGVYHISRRQTGRLLEDVLGVRLSLRAISAIEVRVSDALAEPVAEAWEHVKDADVKHTDGTSWLQAGAMMCLWTVATATATIFKVLAHGSKSALMPLFGKLTGILVSDRATALTFCAMEHCSRARWMMLDHAGSEMGVESLTSRGAQRSMAIGRVADKCQQRWPSRRERLESVRDVSRCRRARR